MRPLKSCMSDKRRAQIFAHFDLTKHFCPNPQKTNLDISGFIERFHHYCHTHFFTKLQIGACWSREPTTEPGCNPSQFHKGDPLPKKGKDPLPILYRRSKKKSTLTRGSSPERRPPVCAMLRSSVLKSSALATFACLLLQCAPARSFAFAPHALFLRGSALRIWSPRAAVGLRGSVCVSSVSPAFHEAQQSREYNIVKQATGYYRVSACPTTALDAAFHVKSQSVRICKRCGEGVGNPRRKEPASNATLSYAGRFREHLITMYRNTMFGRMLPAAFSSTSHRERHADPV